MDAGIPVSLKGKRLNGILGRIKSGAWISRLRGRIWPDRCATAASPAPTHPKCPARELVGARLFAPFIALHTDRCLERVAICVKPRFSSGPPKKRQYLAGGPLRAKSLQLSQRVFTNADPTRHVICATGEGSGFLTEPEGVAGQSGAIVRDARAYLRLGESNNLLERKKSRSPQNTGPERVAPTTLKWRREDELIVGRRSYASAANSLLRILPVGLTGIAGTTTIRDGRL
jgi:hypothetical protein